MENKRILIVSSKWPGRTDSSDGGNSTVRELIDTLKDAYIIDIMYLGNHAESEPREGINKVLYVSQDFDHYEEYAKADESKFAIRLKQADMSAKAIEQHYNLYDKIILIHNMFLMGIESNNKRLLQKIILFPMFTGIDYELCGEIVPEAYILRERSLLNKVKAIVVPSKREKNTLIQMYDVNESLIHEIHRCVDRFSYKERYIQSYEAVEIIYIASIRMQKSHLDAVMLLKSLIDFGLNAKLTCIGAIQDQKIYRECIEKANELGIKQRLVYTGNLEYDALEDILKNADFNISVSKWETFGRGIFEGLAAGVPTLVLSRLESIKDITNPQSLPIICDDLEEMANKICMLVTNKELYNLESKKGSVLRKDFSMSVIKERLKKVLD